MTKSGFTQKQTHRQQTCDCQRGMGEGFIESLRLTDVNCYIYRMENSKVLPCSTGNYIQYPVINHNGEECHKRAYICV